MKKPLLSVVIPVYNAALTLESIATQVYEQEFKDFELILVNDGSTDTTSDILRKLKQQDTRTIVVEKENGGPSSARNTGLKKMQGKYVIFFDADDGIAPKALSTVIETMENTGSDMVVSGWQIDSEKHPGHTTINPTPLTIEENQLKTFVIRSLGTDGTMYNLWNKVFRADIIKTHDLRFREDLRFGEDLIFGLQYLEHVTKLITIPNVTYKYLAGNESGVFSSSSLSVEARAINSQELHRFAGKGRSPEINDLTNWVLWRWQLSYWIIVAGAKKMSLSQKLQLIRKNYDSKLEVAKSSRYIGSKKLWIERITNIVRRIPLLAFMIGKLIHLLKRVVVYIKIAAR